LKTQQTPAAPSVNAWLQRLFLIATGLSSIASVQLFALAERTDQYFAWTIAPPLMAAFHDAGYWGGGTVLLLLASRERVWAQVRVVTSALDVSPAAVAVSNGSERARADQASAGCPLPQRESPVPPR
jgi:hypothetical protein